MYSKGIESHFSKGYDLNQLISILTRYFSINSKSDKLTLDEVLVNLFDILNTEKLYLFHTDPNYISSHEKKIYKVLEISSALYKLGKISKKQHINVVSTIKRLRGEINFFISKNSGKVQCLLEDISTLGDSFGMEGLFDNIEQLTDIELKRYSEKQHPISDSLDSNIVSVEEVREITNYSVREILECTPINIGIQKLGNNDIHTLFWNSTGDGLNYYIPEMSISQYLSFDIPHNIVHLLHLNKIGNGVGSYFDSMQSRSFGESLAVLSEKTIFDLLIKDSKISDDIYSIFKTKIKSKMSREEFNEWMVKDRSFEFRLRCVRLLGDYFLLSGKTLEEAVNIVCNIININYNQIKSEIIKYISELGLGAIYTIGYNRLMDNGYLNPGKILNFKTVPKNWQEFNYLKQKND